MALWPADYIENVLLDVENYHGVRKIVKAGLIERYTVRSVSPEQLHPNPDDEFSQAEYGPNLQIVGQYVDEIKNLHRMSESLIFEEPILVQKMEPDGYLILNGHHRWFAAIRMKLPKVHIKIVNMINEHDIDRMLEENENSKLVSFDFDEVLLTSNEEDQAPLVLDYIGDKFHGRLRAGVPEIIKAFREHGYDVCVMTSGYLDEEEFLDFFKMYDLKVNIILNGMNEKRGATSGKADRLREIIRGKYHLIIHVDNHSLYYFDPDTGDIKLNELDKEINWSDSVVSSLESLEQ